MRLTPNINGTNIQALLVQRRMVLSCIRVLRSAVGDSYPNARDYQLARDTWATFHADQVEWDAFLEAVKVFEEKISEEIVELSDLILARENRR